MEEGAANRLCIEARADPRAAFDALLLGLEATAEPEVRSIILRGLGFAARLVASIADSEEFLARSIEAAQTAGRDDLVGEAIFTLSGTRCLGGDTAAGLRLLDDAQQGASEYLAARIDFQRASIIAREGDLDGVLVLFARALDYFEAYCDDWYSAATLGNRGLVRLDRGDLVGSREDLQRARDLYERLGMSASVAGMEHNLGRIAGLADDVVTALRWFRMSEDKLVALKIDVSEVQVNRCEVLLQAGLYAEAEVVAEETAAAMSRAGLGLERAEALFARSIALRAQSRHADAALAATQAADLFETQKRAGWVMRARLVALSCEPMRSVEAVIDVAVSLEKHAQWLAASEAWALVSEVDASAALAGLAGMPIDPSRTTFELRLTALLVSARAHIERDDARRAMILTREAISLGDRRRLALAPLDLRVAVNAQLAAVAMLGLSVRRRRGRTWDVLQWVDRCRNSSSATTPSAWSDESQMLVAELRAAQVASRSASATDIAPLVRHQAKLQRQLVAERRMQTNGSSRSVGRGRLVRAGDLRGFTIIQHHWLGGRLGAVVVRGGRAELVELGAEADVAIHRTHLLRMARDLVVRDDGSADAAIRSAKVLCGLVLPSCSFNEPTVIAPTADLLGVPWALLPSLADVPVTVAPSLRQWVRGRDDWAPLKSAVFVEGPNIASAAEEHSGVASAWGRSSIVNVASVAEVLSVLASVDVAHFACHGDRRVRDGRFARLVLRDGDLTSFDLEAATRVPRCVVLAACDAGLLQPLPGDQSAGLASALFDAGAHSVIAPVTVIQDSSATAAMFSIVHRHLAAGDRPSAALFAMQQSRTSGPERRRAQLINCYGGG